MPAKSDFHVSTLPIRLDNWDLDRNAVVCIVQSDMRRVLCFAIVTAAVWGFRLPLDMEWSGEERSQGYKLLRAAASADYSCTALALTWETSTPQVQAL